VYRWTEEGVAKLWDLSVRNVWRIVDLEAKDDGVIAGYEADVYRKGELLGRHTLDLKIFTSRSRLVDFSTRLQGVFVGDDKQVQAIHGLVRNMALKEKKTTYRVHRPGGDCGVGGGLRVRPIGVKRGLPDQTPPWSTDFADSWRRLCGSPSSGYQADHLGPSAKPRRRCAFFWIAVKKL
jgi:hypothetical protein